MDWLKKWLHEVRSEIIRWGIGAVLAAALGAIVGIPGIILGWFAELPYWAIWALFCVLVTVGIWAAVGIVRLRDRRAIEAHAPYRDPALYTYDPAEEAADKNAYYDLMEFTTRYLWPACEKQVELQEAVIGRLCTGARVADYAARGFRTDPRPATQAFWKFGALIDCIRGLERGSYKDFVDQLSELAEPGDFDHKTDSYIGPMWEDWRTSHNALVSEYDEKIRHDVRLGKLFRPLRPGRWGGPIPPNPNRGG